MAYATRGLALEALIDGTFPKPVVLSGAQIPKNRGRTDARINLLNALWAASHRKPGKHRPALEEVAIVFAGRIIRAVRARKYSERDLDAFRSINAPDLGSIGTNIQMSGQTMPRQRTKSEFENALNWARGCQFDPGVALVVVFPGMHPEALLASASHARAAVLSGFGAGNIPCTTKEQAARNERNPLSLEEPIKELTASGIPVFVIQEKSLAKWRKLQETSAPRTTPDGVSR